MSPKSEAKGIEALEALLAERRKHEGYLAKLEERRETTPAHVYARLRDEYVTKLTDLQVRAAAEAEALSSGIEHDEAAVAEIEAKLADVTEERIEGELRAEVGEYEPKEWSKKLTVLNATISQLEKERDARAGAYERTRGLLTEATGYAAPSAESGTLAPAPAAGPSAPAHRPSSPRVAVPDPAAPAVDKPSSGPSKAAPMAGPSFDELAFLNSVVGRASAPVPLPTQPRTPTPARTEAPATSAPAEARRAEAPVPAPARAPTPAATPAPEPAAQVTAPAPAATIASAPVPSPAPSPAPIPEPATAPRASAGAPPSLPMQEPSFSSPPPSAEDEPPSPLGRPTPRTSQAIKTLKCQECGTLNYPTEWYCERCGGELAAL